MEGKWVGKEESKVCSDIQDDFKTERLTTPGRLMMTPGHMMMTPGHLMMTPGHLMMTPGQDHLGM